MGAFSINTTRESESWKASRAWIGKGAPAHMLQPSASYRRSNYWFGADVPRSDVHVSLPVLEYGFSGILYRERRPPEMFTFLKPLSTNVRTPVCGRLRWCA